MLGKCNMTDNQSKSINGNKLNNRVHKELYSLMLQNKISHVEKEKRFSHFNSYSNEKVIVDNYFEIPNIYECKEIDEFGVEFISKKPFRIAIDNNTTIRHDRFRGKQYEALLLKEADLIDYFIVLTLDFDEFIVYKNEIFESELVKSFQNDLFSNKVHRHVSNVLTFSDGINFIKDIATKCKGDNLEEIKKQITEIEQKYKYM